MNEIKRKLNSDDLSEEKLKKCCNKFDQPSIINCFENLSNELLCEIFDYFSGFELHEMFSNLNSRFNQLFHSSCLLLKTHFHLFECNGIMNIFKNFMYSNSHQIYSLHINFLLRHSDFFPSFVFNSSFNRLESIYFKDIQSNTLIPILNNLFCLPKLYSLTIETFDIKEEITQIYQLIFLLKKLKYYRIISSNTNNSILLPMSLNNQLSPIEHLIINHYCSLNELTSLISYTSKLRQLTLYKTKTNNLNLMIFSSIILINLKILYLDLCDITFNQLIEFLKKKFPNLNSLSIISSKDITYLDAYRWEELILENFIQLERFYFIYDDVINNERNYPIYTGRLNQFNSIFWFERQWIFEVEINDINIEYAIRPYKKKWYNDNIQYSKFTNLTCECIPDSIFENTIPIEIERILTITQIHHLEINEKKISMPLLIQTINLLPDIITLKIHSLLVDETIELTVKELLCLCSMKETSQITKIYLEEFNDIQELNFLFTLCPFMEYFKIGTINNMDIQSFLRIIFKKINRNNNHYLRLLCIQHSITTDDRILENIQKMFPYLTVKYILDTIYLQWK